MSNTSPKPLIALALAVALAAPMTLAAPAWAGDTDHVAAREALKRGQIVPLSKVLAVVGAKVPGDVIDVELELKKEGWRYEVKVLTASGQVREVKLDARNAAVLKIEDD